MQKVIQNIILEMTEDQFHVLIGSVTLMRMLFATHPVDLIKESNAKDKLQIGLAVAHLEERSKAFTTLSENLAKMVTGITNQDNV